MSNVVSLGANLGRSLKKGRLIASVDFTKPRVTRRGLPGRLTNYQPGDRCDQCGGTSWAVGRVTAECARCENIRPVDATMIARLD